MKRIVIADDANLARMYIQKCLEIAGPQDAKFEGASNGKEALELIKKEKTDLLVTDLNMPIMDGLTLLKWIKSNPLLKDTPVIVITSVSNVSKNLELQKFGAHKVLSKPITPAIIHNAIEQLF